MHNDTRRTLSKLLNREGVSPGYSGYDYLVHAIKMRVEDEGEYRTPAMEVYKQVGEKYGKTAIAVERAIRYSLERSGINRTSTSFIEQCAKKVYEDSDFYGLK